MDFLTEDMQQTGSDTSPFDLVYRRCCVRQGYGVIRER